MALIFDTIIYQFNYILPKMSKLVYLSQKEKEMAQKKRKDADKKITIDEVEYSLDTLSDEAQKQLVNIQFVDNQIQQLNNELAVADTARIGYTKALKKELEMAASAKVEK